MEYYSVAKGKLPEELAALMLNERVAAIKQAGLGKLDEQIAMQYFIERLPHSDVAVAAAMDVRFEHISAWCWNATMNMMYSDYYNTAMKFGVCTPEFFGELAKEFLFDKDGPEPKEKLAAYYRGIVER